MEAVILFFSGTGNTRLVAKAVATGLFENGIRAELIEYKKWDALDFSKVDLIGIAHPVYFWKPPLPVILWLKSSLPTGNKKAAFVFCSYSGALSRGLQISCEIVLSKGYRLIGADYFLAEEAHPRLRFPFYIPSRNMPDAKELNKARMFGAQVASRYARWKKDPESVQDVVFPRDRGLLKLMGDAISSSARMRIWLGSKRVDLKRCNGCGACERKCPTYSIKLDGRYPVFNESSCIGCGTCYNICPCDAVLLRFSYSSRYRGPSAGNS